VGSCVHLEATPLTAVREDFEPLCTECVAAGSQWLHLRRCLTCQQVACCDSSPGKHASRHARAMGHPVVTSAEPGESWRWCYVHEVGA
jgi:CPA1 family monovalent cation:H+ antiporter